MCLQLWIPPKWVWLANTNTLPAFFFSGQIQEALGSAFKLIEKLWVKCADFREPNIRHPRDWMVSPRLHHYLLLSPPCRISLWNDRENILFDLAFPHKTLVLTSYNSFSYLWTPYVKVDMVKYLKDFGVFPGDIFARNRGEIAWLLLIQRSHPSPSACVLEHIC
jgi:hypothetical protein